MTLSSTGVKPKPVLDEGGFQQLLAAAYVLQQHNDSLHAKDPRLDAAWIFSQITETENLVRQGGLTFAEAAKLVGARLCSMTGAVSASVCLLRDGRTDCVSEAGVAAQAVGCSLAGASAAAEERLRNGRQFQSLDAQSDSRLDRDMCREMGVRSLLAVPIQKSEQTAGLIEVRWGLTNAIHECDVRTCRLMANLLAEVLERNEARSFTESTLPPNDALAESEKPRALNKKISGPIVDPQKSQNSSDLAEHCRVCGRAFSSDEAFCGHCSMPRVAASAKSDGLQSKWASMWFMRQAQESRPQRNTESKFLPASPPLKNASTAAHAKPSELPVPKSEAPKGSAFFAPPEPPSANAPAFAIGALTAETSHSSVSASSEEISNYFVPEQGLRIFEDEPAIDAGPQAWPSFFSHLRPLLSLRIKISRRTVTLAVCSIVAFVFFVSWISWPAQPSSHLSWFESVLVDLGLAEVQARRPAPVYAGNPNVRVWEDVHTALYYCPDSDLYGKTPGGRFSTQRSAQEDQFESATRIACQ